MLAKVWISLPCGDKTQAEAVGQKGLSKLATRRAVQTGSPNWQQGVLRKRMRTAGCTGAP